MNKFLTQHPDQEEVKKMPYRNPLLEVTSLTMDDVVPYYVDLILYTPVAEKDEVKRVNNLILSKWSSSGLTYIKEKAWHIVENRQSKTP